MKTFGIFDESGAPLAFYNEDIHGAVGSAGCLIPSEAIEITYSQWLEFINNNGERRLVDGKVIVSNHG